MERHQEMVLNRHRGAATPASPLPMAPLGVFAWRAGGDTVAVTPRLLRWPSALASIGV